MLPPAIRGALDDVSSPTAPDDETDEPDTPPWE